MRCTCGLAGGHSKRTSCCRKRMHWLEQLTLVGSGTRSWPCKLLSIMQKVLISLSSISYGSLTFFVCISLYCSLSFFVSHLLTSCFSLRLSLFLSHSLSPSLPLSLPFCLYLSSLFLSVLVCICLSFFPACKRPQTPSVFVVNAGSEHLHFTNMFPYWNESRDVQELNCKVQYIQCTYMYFSHVQFTTS